MKKVVLLAAAALVVWVGVKRLRRGAPEAPPASPRTAPAGQAGDAAGPPEAPAARYREPVGEAELAGYVRGVEERLDKIMAPVEERLRAQVARRASCLRETRFEALAGLQNKNRLERRKNPNFSLDKSEALGLQAINRLEEAYAAQVLCEDPSGKGTELGASHYDRAFGYNYMRAHSSGKRLREACLMVLSGGPRHLEELRSLPEAEQARICGVLYDAAAGRDADPCKTIIDPAAPPDRPYYVPPSQAYQDCRLGYDLLYVDGECLSRKERVNSEWMCETGRNAVRALRAKDPSICGEDRLCRIALGADSCSRDLVQEARAKAVRAHCEFVGSQAAMEEKGASGAMASAALKELYSLLSDYRKFYEEYRQRKPGPPVPPRFGEILEARKKIEKLFS